MIIDRINIGKNETSTPVFWGGVYIGKIYYSDKHKHYEWLPKKSIKYHAEALKDIVYTLEYMEETRLKAEKDTNTPPVKKGGWARLFSKVW